MVAIVVGENATVIHAHESVIRSKSPFFAAALSKNWKEGSELRVRLPEDQPEIVKLYVQWLYSRKIFINWTTEIDKWDGNQSLPEYFTLAHLYVLGEKCCDVMFKNAVVDAFLRRMGKKIGKSRWYPIGKVADIVYNGTPSISRLRKLMVDAHVRCGYGNWVGAPSEDQNKEFLVDLVHAMYTKLKEPEQTFQSLGTEYVAATYHESEGGRRRQSVGSDDGNQN